MIDLRVGTVVRIEFPFTDKSESKTAPVVVLTSRRYHEERQDFIAARITSKIAQKDTFGTVEIHDHVRSGLQRPSVIKPVLMTLAQKQILGVLGQLDDRTLRDLKRVFVKDIFAGMV